MRIPKHEGLGPNEIADNDFVYDSAWHIHACLAWLNFVKRTARHACLKYAAIELRSGIELLWFEIFVMSMGGSIGAKEYVRCTKEVTKMYKLIDSFAPDYDRMMPFMQVILDLESESKEAPQVAVWDISRLKRYHGEASEFLHFQGIPQETFEDKLWLGRSLEKLERMAIYIWKEMTGGKQTGNMSPDEMEPETRTVWEQYKSGLIDLTSVRTQLQIIWPTLAQRGKLRRSIK